jgi:hypothetical protein
MSDEQPGTIKWGASEEKGPPWLATDRPVTRGAGLGCAVVGFGLLVAAEVLPWASLTTTPIQQDFPTGTGGRMEYGITELPFSTEMFNLGWMIVLAAVATALVLRSPARIAVAAAGLGLIAGQVALLVGLTRAIQHNGVFRGTFLRNTELPVQLEVGLYCAYAALALFAVALLLAGGVPRRLRGPDPEPDEAGPADLTVTPAGPADLTVTPDPTAWAQRQAELEVGGRRPER